MGQRITFFVAIQYFFFWLHSWHVEIPSSGIEPVPQKAATPSCYNDNA